MKKVIMSAVMAIALIASSSVMAQDAKKDAPKKAKTEKSACTKEKKECTEKAEKKSCCSKDKK